MSNVISFPNGKERVAFKRNIAKNNSSIYLSPYCNLSVKLFMKSSLLLDLQ